jgi:hypothetical protein
MGVEFKRIKISVNETTGQSEKASYSDELAPPLFPLVGIKRITTDGRANKYSMQYSEVDVNGRRIYKTIWQPLGQEGWQVRLQSSLMYRAESYDEIANWLTVETGEVLEVTSNRTGPWGEDTSTYLPYDDLEPGTLWYVEHILIQSVKGTPEKADMELTLMRCWE